MPKRILHIGNIANNAYNNAKHLNQTIRESYIHDALNFDNPHVMACPEWEEVETLVPVSEFNPSWPSTYIGHPSWYKYLETTQLKMDGSSVSFKLFSKLFILRRSLAYWLKDQGLKKIGWQLQLPVSFLGKLKVFVATPIYLCLHIYSFFFKKMMQVKTGSSSPSIYSILSKKLAKQLDGYDLIQGYGPDIIIPYLLRLPYIAYEHGTLREMPFDETMDSRLLNKAYKNAIHVIITNPDVLKSARKLGLKNYSFIPHAVDTNRFSPGEEVELRQHFGIAKEDKVILAPARQNWTIKGNDRLVLAFSRLKQDNENVKLLLCDWGQNRDLTKGLVKEHGLEKNVIYYPPVPKLTSVKLIRMADVVVDQFEAGTFGGISPEAMACEKPTLVYFEEKYHMWCFKKQPPVVSVKTIDDIYEKLSELLSSKELCKEIGIKSRVWVIEEYSITQLVERHEKIYKKILN